MDWITMMDDAVLFIALCILVSASVSDFRTREVSDRHWYALGAVGVGGNFIIGLFSDGPLWLTVLDAALCSVFLLSILGDHGKWDLVLGTASLLSAIITIITIGNVDNTQHILFGIPLGCLFLIGYWFGVIRGGADAKCLICAGFVFPQSISCIDPQVGFLADILLSPGLAMLLIASIVSLCGCATYCICRNIAAHDAISIQGYLLSLSRAESSHVWPLVDVSEGRIERCPIPDDECVGQIYSRLRGAGADRILVTPMVPFIIPLTLSFAIIAIFGNPVILLY